MRIRSPTTGHWQSGGHVGKTDNYHSDSETYCHNLLLVCLKCPDFSLNKALLSPPSLSVLLLMTLYPRALCESSRHLEMPLAFSGDICQRNFRRMIQRSTSTYQICPRTFLLKAAHRMISIPIRTQAHSFLATGTGTVASRNLVIVFVSF